MNEAKVVVLERAVQGSFGFSILGGAGMRYPACVCEVDEGGQADLSHKVMVGDRLLKMNGEDMVKLPPKDLVQYIRQAPSPSTFVLVEDLDLRRQVNHILRKKERRAGARKDRGSTSSESSLSGSGTAAADTSSTAAGKTRRKSSPSYTGPAEEPGRKKKLDKIIEVEPSVNISNGQSGIVQVHRNKIVGRITSVAEPSSPSSRQSPGRLEVAEGESPRGSPQRESPGRNARPAERAGSNSPYQNHKKFMLPEHSGSTPNIPYSTANNSVSNNSTHLSAHSLDHTPEHAWSSDDRVMNGEVRILSDSSDMTSPSETPATGSVASFDNKSNKSSDVVIVEGTADEGMTLEEVGNMSLHRQDEDANFDSGVALQIPAWDGHPLQSRFGKTPRASLSEEILVGEISKQAEGDRQDHVEGSPVTAERLRANDVASSSPQKDRSQQIAKIVRRSSSKRKAAADPYASAVSMARRLYMLDGYKRSEIAAKLSDQSDHGKTVASEYLKFFEFQGLSLVESLRQFLTHFSLTGESQERERVMVHFSNHYHECNPAEYESVDTVHGITIALLLLNTDLHADHGSKKMTAVQFSTNIAQVAKGVSKSVLRSLYDEIKKKPLQWAHDDNEGATSISSPQEMAVPDMESSSSSSEAERVYHVTIPGTFVEAELPDSAPLFKEGYVLKKNIMEAPHKKVPRGRRQWRPYYAYLKGFLLYLQPPRQGDIHFEDTSSALSICHTIAMGASDYHKKNSVLRVTTAEWQSFLLQATNTMDMQQWIAAINKAAASYSSPPLAAPVSSSSSFQRPTFPLTPTRNTLEQQAESHEARVNSLRKEHEEHQAYKPTGSKAKHNDLQNWFDKFEFLQFEIDRFQIYYASLFNNSVDFQTKLPSGLVPSPSISTLATSGTGDGNSELSAWKSVTPPGSPSKHRSDRKGGSKQGQTSPLVSSKRGHKRK